MRRRGSPRRPHCRLRGGSGGADKHYRNKPSERSPWRPDKYASQLLFDIVNSRSPLSGPGNDSQCFAHSRSIIRTPIGRKELGKGMAVFWQKFACSSDAFRSEFWEMFLQPILTELGGTCRQLCVGMAWERLVTEGNAVVATVTGGGQPRCVGQFGFAALGEVVWVSTNLLKNV